MPAGLFSDAWAAAWAAEINESAAYRAADDLERAAYVLRAPAAVWKQVLGGDLEPVGAVLIGLMELSRGSLISLAPHVPAAKELLSAAARVETAFPEGWA